MTPFPVLKWTRLILPLSLAAVTAPDACAAEPGSDHMREELGVNVFTAPPIRELLEDLAGFGTGDLSKARRDVPGALFTSRPRTALLFGGLIADGFLCATEQDRSAIEPLARAMMKRGRGLGVGDVLTRRGQSLVELGAQNQWDKLRSELAAAQEDVEKAMFALRDEEIAHLVSLGGWLRALEIGATVTADAYSERRAELLIRRELLAYFLDRLSTLNPELKGSPLFNTITTRLRELQGLFGPDGSPPPPVETVRRIKSLAHDLNERISGA